MGKHDSDCAVHNEPAFPAGECDCGIKVNLWVSDLLPCPWCNGSLSLNKKSLESGDGWYVACENDDCMVQPCTHMATTADGAIEFWNQRKE